MFAGDEVNVYNATSRVKPLPEAPWGGGGPAYAHSKVLTLHATERFLEEKKPHFTVVNVLPGFVIGRGELCKNAEDLMTKTTNYVVLGPVLGQESFARPYGIIDVKE